MSTTMPTQDMHALMFAVVEKRPRQTDGPEADLPGDVMVVLQAPEHPEHGMAVPMSAGRAATVEIGATYSFPEMLMLHARLD